MTWWVLVLIVIAWLAVAVCILSLCVRAKSADTQSEELQRDQTRRDELRREALRAKGLLGQARELHRLAPSRETRLLVVLGEASSDLVMAIQAEDWDTARAFKFQVETIEALLMLRDPERVVQPMERWHQDLVEAAWQN